MSADHQPLRSQEVLEAASNLVEPKRAKIQLLATTPRPQRELGIAKRLAPGGWPLRILYEIDDARSIVDIAVIRDRSEAHE